MKEAALDGRIILVIEDDLLMRDLLQDIFEQAGARVVMAPDGVAGLRRLYAHHPDLVILDIMMPLKDGWTVCRQIREISDVPIIILTALSTEEDIVRGFELGALDYVTKPFSVKVLLARSRAALRQAAPVPGPAPAPGYRDPFLHVDLVARQVSVDGRAVTLTKTEFELLAYLVHNAGRVLTFEQILAHVWGDNYGGSDSYVHTYVSRLRGKLEPNPRRPTYLLSQRGVGYRFAPRV